MASGIPLAVGAALAFKMRGEDRVAVPFTGDAGGNTGNWHEGLNMASIWDLPVVFVLENNHYGVSTRIERHGQESRICPSARRATASRAFGWTGSTCWPSTRQRLPRWPAPGPATAPRCSSPRRYRLDGHYAGEPEVYRDRAEVAGVPGQGPDRRASGASSRARGSSAAAELDAIDAEVAQELDEAIAFAKASPEPDPATAMDYIYA